MTQPTRESLLPTLQSALAFAADQARQVVEKYPGYYPMYTIDGRWKQEPEHWTHWCEGFYPGIFWLLHGQTGDPGFRHWAEEYSSKLEPRKHDRKVHDLGFLFFSTYLRWYHQTGDPALAEVLVEAGRTLARRRQKGAYLSSFIGPESLFIDIMMNVGIILWAANATDDEKLRKVALEHCQTTAKYLVRPDGGTAHEGIFNVLTGQFERESTHQGFASQSCWSRGLAWAIYGFTAVHRLAMDWHAGHPKRAIRLEQVRQDRSRSPAWAYTDEYNFLFVACRCAEYYLRKTPPHLVPYWDYDAPVDDPPLWDSSAAAIAASGLWDLSEAVTDLAEQQKYQSAALTILKSLCSDQFLARGRPGWEGILLHGVYHKHKDLGVDESVAWGDHFFVEALVKAGGEVCCRVVRAGVPIGNLVVNRQNATRLPQRFRLQLEPNEW